MTYANGEKYTGNWTSDKRHGTGKLYSANGTPVKDGYWKDGNYVCGYTGEYKDDQRSGYGTEEKPGGDVYKGEWRINMKDGQGTFTDSHGSYTGTWKADKRQGQGSITWVTGETYEGLWQDDKMAGQGTYTWPNGQQPAAMKNVVKYTGGFSYNMFTGYGKCYNRKGRLVKKGYWSSNIYMGKHKKK